MGWLSNRSWQKVRIPTSRDSALEKAYQPEVQNKAKQKERSRSFQEPGGEMKAIVTLSLAFVFCVLLLSATATAQGGVKPVADCGMIPLGPKEELRLTVALGDVNNDNIRVRFRLTEYTAGICTGSVCKHFVMSQTTSPPMMLNANEAASTTFPTTVESEDVRFVRGVVLSDNPNVRVRGIVFDTSTQRINSICTFIPD